MISRMATATTNRTHTKMENLTFDNLALRVLPIDPQEEVYPRQVPGACFSKVKPTPLQNPKVVAISPSALELLGLNPEDAEKDANFVEYMGGNKTIPGSDPAAHCYCGHQFGSFAGQLGDGATMYLGEVINHKGERWEMQFKGAGLTPYSRSADGRKVLRSSIREFLCSEAMHHLGVPTTRAGTCVTSDTRVVRDIFYNGNPIRERCTVITRIAPTFLRFGSFEIFKALDDETRRNGPSHGRTDILDVLLDYTISTFYPDIDAANDDRHIKNLAFFTEVVKRTAKLVAHWQCVGFCHGVLNTDNMSILGLTIDYGPYGFMDRFDPDFICNVSDDGGRYTYTKQPQICKWNLMKLAEAIQDAVPVEETKQIVQDTYDIAYKEEYHSLMSKKLGLLSGEINPDLISSLLETMHTTGSDFTNTFRALHLLPYPSSEEYLISKVETMKQLQSQCCSVTELKDSLRPTIDPRQFQMLVMLAQSQPMFLSMMGMEGKLKAELDRKEKFQQVENLAEEEKRERDMETWTIWLEKYENALKTDYVKTQASGSKDTIVTLNSRRCTVMNSANPTFILRNWVAQNAIAKAEGDDYTEVKNVLRLLENPYSNNYMELQQSSSASGPVLDEHPPVQTSDDQPSSFESCSGLSYVANPPDWARDIKVT